MRPLVDHLVEFHDVRMPQVGQGVYLSVHRHLGLLVLQVLLVVCFNSDNVLRVFMLCAPHYCESPSPDLQVYLEVFHVERLLVRIQLPPLVDHVSE